MKKIIFIFFSLFLFAYQNNNINSILKDRLNNDKVFSETKNTKYFFNSYEEYLKYIHDIQTATTLDNAYYFYLGLLYFNNVTIKNGPTIKADINKALHYFRKSNTPLSAYYIALILTSKGQIFSALKVLEEKLKNLDKEEGYNILAFEYAVIVLDNLPETKPFLKKAIKFMENVDYTPLNGYVFANLLYFSGNVKKANEVINVVCKSNDKSVKKLCQNSPFLEKVK